MLSCLRIIKKRFNQYYSAFHVLFGRYEKINAPEFDANIYEYLSSDNSPFTRLLKGNSSCVREAEQIINGRMIVYGRDMDFNDDRFNWHRDILSDKIYPQIPYCLLNLDQNQRDHIISVWELSRLYFVPTLIAAHIKTGEDTYAAYFAKVFDDWIVHNPLHRGANWYCALDIAVRAFNILLGIAYFGKVLKNTDLYRSVLWAHVQYIHKTDLMKKKSRRNNHYLISIALLAILACSFDCNEAKAISHKAFEELSNEILIQFKVDGGNFESSTGYHQMSLEGVLIAASLGQFDRRFQFDENVLKVVSNAVRLVKDYMTSFGRSPHFGDSCDGRIFVFRDYYSKDPTDHSFIDNMYSAFVGNTIQTDGKGWYPESGYGFWLNERYGMCFNCSHAGNNTSGGKGHEHCDKTSFVLQMNGHPVFVDSGTCCYLADVNKRSQYRSTPAHNLILIDNKEQAAFDPDLCFGPLDTIDASIDYHSQNGIAYWRMEHNGYSTSQENIRVIRDIQCYDDHIEITENLSGEREHAITIQYHVHPSVSLNRSEDKIYIKAAGSPLGFMTIPDGFEATILPTYYSPAYGMELQNQKIVFEQYLQLPTEIIYRIACI